MTVLDKSDLNDLNFILIYFSIMEAEIVEIDGIPVSELKNVKVVEL